MLVEFSVENYLSFREKVTLSMVASPDTSLRDRVIPDAGGTGLDLLKAVAIYGPNASGKSNLLQAVTFAVHEAVASGPRGQAGAEIERIHFAFAEGMQSAPTRFAIAVVGRLGTHRLEASVNDTQYLEERFTTTAPGRRERVVYERRFDGETRKHSFRIGRDWTTHLGKLVKLVRPNASFASVAASLGSEILGDFVAVLSGTLDLEAGVLDDDSINVPPELITSDQLADFARIADPQLRRIAKASSGGTKSARASSELAYFYPGAGRRNAPTEVEIPEDWVSEGTRKMVRFYAPVMASARGGRIMLVDELESHLHPLVSREVLRRYFATPSVDGGGQMIFTTHDAELLDTSFLRRDQIYLMERDPTGASRLSSLWDFREDDGEHVRKDVDVRARYLVGRYGSIPIIGNP